MAEIAEGGGGGHDKGKKRAKKNSTKVDMTPMVDLAFLLLTFFVLTTTFAKPKVMSLVYPAKVEDTDPKDQTKINNAITFILTEDRVFYYEDEYFPVGNSQGKPPTELTEIKNPFGPEGVRKLLAKGNKYVLDEKARLEKLVESKQMADTTYANQIIKAKQDKRALKVLIKTDDKAICKNFIDLVDELKIAEIGMIAPVDIMKSELDLLNAKVK
jgi:biopolymer transport protein ExbD